jgi:hypothetical protein
MIAEPAVWIAEMMSNSDMILGFDSGQQGNLGQTLWTSAKFGRRCLSRSAER